MLDSAIHQINYYPVDKYWENNIAYIIHVLNNWGQKEGFEWHQHSH